MCKKCFKVLLSEFIIIIILMICSCSVREKTDEVYESCKSSFSCINEIMLNCDDGVYMFDTAELNGKGNILGIFKYENSEEIYLDISQEGMNALNDMKDNLIYDFSVICIKEEMIYYGGIGPQAYVYSKTGDPPQSYIDSSGIDFWTYQIDDNWYLLQL